MTRAELIQFINANIYPNGRNQITAPMVRDSILAVVGFLGDAAVKDIGAVLENNTDLVTGGAVYDAIRAYLSSVMKMVGETTTDVITNPTANPVYVDGEPHTAQKGDVVVYGYKEFWWTGSIWKELGDEASWALKTISITGTGDLTGGGTLEANRTLDLTQSAKDKLAHGETAFSWLESYSTNRLRLKSPYSYLNARKGLIFDANEEADTNADFEKVALPGGGYALHSRLPFYSDSFISAGGISPGGGTSAGNATLVAQTYGGTLSATGIEGINFYSKERVDQLLLTAGTVQTVAGVSPTSGDIPVASLKSALGLGAAAAYGIGSVASGSTGLVTGGSVYSAINEAVSSVMKMQGTTTTPLSDGSTTNPVVIDGSSYTAKKGDVVLYDGKEYLWAGSAWEQLGDEASWALKTTSISAGTGLDGGGTLASNRTISINSKYQTYISNGNTAYGWGDWRTRVGTLETNLTALTTRVTTLEGRTNWDTYFGVDENGDVYVKKNGDTARNFYSWGAVSAGGLSSGGGASGIDLAAMWGSLTNSISDAYATTKIAAAHIPDLSGTYLPLTGGTIHAIDFPLNIKTDSATGAWNGIHFIGANNQSLGYYVMGNSNYSGPYYVTAGQTAGYRIWHEGIFSPSDYLARTGGTMTGTILWGAYTAFGVTDGTFYLGSPAYPVNLRSNGTTQINGNTIWHAGNSNLSTVPWACSSLYMNGGIESVTTITTANGSAFGFRYRTDPTWASWARSALQIYTDNNIMHVGAYGNSGTQIDFAFFGGAYDSGYAIRVYPGSYPTVGDNVIWHAGNDGANSGLDADLLDGRHAGTWASTAADVIPIINSDGVMEVGKYFDFHNVAGESSDFSCRLTCNGNNGNEVYLPTGSGTLALTSGSVGYLDYHALTSSDDCNRLPGCGVYVWTDANDPANAYGTNSVMLSLYNYRPDCLQIAYSANSASVALRFGHLIGSGIEGWSSWNTILTGENYSSFALPLSGGTMTGTILWGAYTAFGVTDGTFYLGSPAYPVNLRSNGTTQINGNTIWHAGNSNLSTVPWACSTLTASGNIDATGTIHSSTGIWSEGYVSAGGLASSSDERLKSGIKDFGYSAEMLMALRPREWDWNAKSYMKGHAAGVVAQELRQVMPYAIVERQYLSVNYDMLHGLEIAGLQDHETRIRQLEAENRELKRRLNMN